MQFWKFKGLSYLKNFFVNYVSDIKTPYSAQIELTLQCMANCKFCAIPSIPKSLKNPEMSTNEVKSIIDQIVDLGILALSFTGGEPTLRHDLPELINYAGYHNNLTTGLATNGYYLPDLFKHNSFMGLDYILLSLDFPDAKHHDRMRALNVFEKVIESIALAQKHNINVIISTNVMKSNLKYLPELCELAEKLDCSIELYPCEDIIRTYDGRQFQANGVNDLIPDLHLWAELVKSLRKNYKNVLTDLFSIESIEKGAFGGNPKYQNILRCHVAEAYLFIRHNGFIDFPCKINPLISFNALKYPLSDIYRSEKVIEIMKQHDSYDFCDHCRLGCSIAASLTARWPSIYEKYIKSIFRGNLR
ncbi:MAG: radical SAM protein [Promethearchaeota archaeon]|nr:MAG: radical SAM protein [Candidatus Lokiarchaeota archaeon]